MAINKSAAKKAFNAPTIEIVEVKRTVVAGPSGPRVCVSCAVDTFNDDPSIPGEPCEFDIVFCTTDDCDVDFG